VRNLERTLATLCRKVTRRIATGENGPFNITNKNIEEFLGHATFIEKDSFHYDQPGIATGLAWTSVGGEVLFIEARQMVGKTPLTITGQIGKVMQESAMAALTFIRSNHDKLGLKPDFLEGKEVHVHVPAGAIPKDGPSAGITIATAMISLFTNTIVRKRLAMTGEITLSGKVLPIGGLKEKVLAAYRYGMREIILPKTNESHIEDVPEEVRSKMTFYPVSEIMEVFEIAFSKKTARGSVKKTGQAKKAPVKKKKAKIAAKKTGNGEVIKKRGGKTIKSTRRRPRSQPSA